MEQKLINLADHPTEKSVVENEKPRKTRIIGDILFYASAPFIALLFFTVYIALLGIYPFGSSIMSSYDLLAQIGPFAEHFFDVLEGKSTLFYSFSIAGGADTFGSLAYCMISPFTFIFLLGGKGMVNYMVPFVLGAKIVCIALSACFFIKKLFPSIPKFIGVVLAVLYTYSGYFHVANTYINWLDFMIYFPLAVVAFSRFMKTGKFLMFSLSISACIYCCFSIACFSLLIIFPILIAYGWLCVEKDKRKEALVKISLSLLLAVAFSLPLIIPALMAYSISGRNTGLFDNLFNSISADHLYNKISYVLIDTVFFVLGLYYLIMSDKKIGKNKFLVVATILIFSPVLVDEICILLNAGSYMSYALRFGFLNSILGLYLTCMVFSTDPQYKTKGIKKWLISSIIAIILVALCSLVILFVSEILKNGEESIVFTWWPFKEGGAIYEMFKEAKFSESFSSKFAHSIGGLEIIIFIFVIFSIAIACVIVCYKLKLMPTKIAVVILVAISLMQTGFSTYHTVLGNKNTMITYDQVLEVLKEIETAEEDNIYRVKDYDDKVSAVAPLTLHYNSYSVFSSVIDEKNFAPTSFFGYSGNGVNSIKSRGGNVFSDSLLGYKYAFSKNTKLSSDNWKKISEKSGFNLFENECVFPTAFKIPGGDYDLTVGTYAERMDRLYNFLGGEGELTAKRKPTKITYSEDDDYFTVETYSEKGVVGNAYLVADFPKDISVRYTHGLAYEEEDNFEISDNFRIDAGFTRDTAYRSISIKAEKGKLTEEIILNSVYMATVSLEKIKELCDIAWTNQVEVDFGADTINGTVTASDGDFIFVNCIATKGYECRINGAKTNLMENDLKFLVAPLNAGENTVVFEYTSPYVKYIIIGILLGAILAFGVILVFRFYMRLHAVFEKTVFVLANALACVVIGLGFIFPLFVFLGKCIKALLKL